MTAHVCTVCYQESSGHRDECEADECADAMDREGRHWPPLCCPGCSCESYERAHEEMP